jgi:hypothetical protein
MRTKTAKKPVKRDALVEKQPERHGLDWRRGKTKYTPEQLCDLCEDYLSTCSDAGKKPTWQGLAGFVGVTSGTLNEWMNNKESLYTPGLSVVLKKTADAISDQLQQRTDCMAMISMKQPLYGGFVDKPAQQDASISNRFSAGRLEAQGGRMDRQGSGGLPILKPATQPHPVAEKQGAVREDGGILSTRPSAQTIQDTGYKKNRGWLFLNATKKISKQNPVIKDGYGLCPLHWNKLFRVDEEGRIWVWCKACRAEHEVKIVKEP